MFVLNIIVNHLCPKIPSNGFNLTNNRKKKGKKGSKVNKHFVVDYVYIS